MAIKVNQSKQYRIYIKGSKSWVDVNKEFYTNYYRDINAYRKRQQEHGRCVCPASKRYLCDMDCMTCPYAKAGDQLSLDNTVSDGEGNEKSWLDDIIPKDIYLQVQEELVRRRVVKTSANGKKRSYSCNHCFSQIVICGECGEMFRRLH